MYTYELNLGLFRNMKSIKFSAKTKNGVIVIPKKYQQRITSPVEVTLHYKEIAAKAKARKNIRKNEIDTFFNNFRIDLSGFRFNRDEANQR
jgi:hypothetical protein